MHTTKPHKCCYRCTPPSHIRVHPGVHHQATQVFLQVHTTKPHTCFYRRTPPSHTSVFTGAQHQPTHVFLQAHTTKPHMCFYRRTPLSHTSVFTGAHHQSHTSVSTGAQHQATHVFLQAHNTKPHTCFYRRTPPSHTSVFTGAHHQATQAVPTGAQHQARWCATSKRARKSSGRNCHYQKTIRQMMRRITLKLTQIYFCQHHQFHKLINQHTPVTRTTVSRFVARDARKHHEVGQSADNALSVKALSVCCLTT